MSSADPQARERAKERAEKKLGFYVHLAVYVVVNAVLAGIDLTTSPEKTWFYWPLAGWGIGVALHAYSVYFGDRTSRLQRKMIERELEREQRPEA